MATHENMSFSVPGKTFLQWTIAGHPVRRVSLSSTAQVDISNTVQLYIK